MTRRAAAPRRLGCADCSTSSRCPVGVSPQAVVSIGALIRERAFGAGDTLVREGAPAQHLKVVKLGMVFLSRGDGLGGTRPVAVAGSGFACSACSHTRQPWQVSVIAAASGRSCELPFEHVRAAATQDAVFREALARLMGINFGLLANWAEAIGRKGVLGRVARCVELVAQQQMGVQTRLPSQAAMAELLGTTRESVARALARLEDEGCIGKRPGQRYEVFAARLHAWLRAQHGAGGA